MGPGLNSLYCGSLSGTRVVMYNPCSCNIMILLDNKKILISNFTFN